MIPFEVMNDGASVITNVLLEKSQERVKTGEQLTLSLSFKVEGMLRDAFNQKNWERAYNKHDNLFRLTIVVKLKSGRKTIKEVKLVRKAAHFWTRNPKIHHRIWVSIVKDDTPFYPLTEEEAKSFLFDVNKVIEVEGVDLGSGNHKISAEVSVSWGKHEYTAPGEISAKSNEISTEMVKAQ